MPTVAKEGQTLLNPAPAVDDGLGYAHECREGRKNVIACNHGG